MRRLALGLLLRLHSSLSHRARASAPTPPSRTCRTSARSAADAAGLGAAVGGRASAAAGSASLDSSSAAAARPALLFFFLDFFEPSSSSFVALGRAAPPYIGERSYIIAASCIACGGTTAAGCGGATCCRVGSAVGFSVPRRAVPLFSSSSVSAPAVRVRLKASVAIAPNTPSRATPTRPATSERQRSTQGDAEATNERRDACCCRMSSAMVGWPAASTRRCLYLYWCAARWCYPWLAAAPPHGPLALRQRPASERRHPRGVLQVRVGRVLQEL